MLARALYWNVFQDFTVFKNYLPFHQNSQQQKVLSKNERKISKKNEEQQEKGRNFQVVKKVCGVFWFSRFLPSGFVVRSLSLRTSILWKKCSVGERNNGRIYDKSFFTFSRSAAFLFMIEKPPNQSDVSFSTLSLNTLHRIIDFRSEKSVFRWWWLRLCGT